MDSNLRTSSNSHLPVSHGHAILADISMLQGHRILPVYTNAGFPMVVRDGCQYQ